MEKISSIFESLYGLLNNVTKAISSAFLTMIMLSTLFACSKPENVLFREGKIEDIFNAAKIENKKVFILIADNNCGSCVSLLRRINENEETKEILKKEYICYRANINDAKSHLIAEIVKCPSYPFPYFFDKEGNMLAFGFPNSKDFVIKNLSRFTIDSRRFAELFRLPISSDDYKMLVSLSLKAYLLPKLNRDSIARSISLYKASMAITTYPFNYRNLKLLSQLEMKSPSLLKVGLSYNFSPIDDYLYGDVRRYMFLPKVTDEFGQREKEVELVESSVDLGDLTKGKIYPFKFKIRNNSGKTIRINSINPPCDCIKLKWREQEIKGGSSVSVEASFSPYETGKVVKPVYVHSSSTDQPIATFTVFGNTN